MSGPVERPDAEALDLGDRVAIVETRLDLVAARLATSTRQPSPAEVRAETVRQHQRDVVLGIVAAFVALVLAVTFVLNAAIEAGKDVLS